MNGYILFAGCTYYPGGGWQDYAGNFWTLEAATSAAANLTCDWWQVVSLAELKVVASGHRT